MVTGKKHPKGERDAQTKKQEARGRESPVE